MDILDTIIEFKKSTLPLRKGLIPPVVLEKFPYFNRTCISLADRLKAGDTTGIIAEFKRQSPSKGIINATAVVEEVTGDYANYGAAAISVLTDDHFFGGSSEDLMAARDTVNIPILRKDFVLDEYQIIEARAMGADAILLIAAVLSKSQVKQLARFARSLEMQVLLEIHGRQELDRLCEFVDMVGVNNRDLNTFEVNMEVSLDLVGEIPCDFVRISESGITSPLVVKKLRSAGYQGFLIGENFMRSPDPVVAFSDFVKLILSDYEQG
jgi:indole-3-glycerol phosphate synthase